MTASAIFFDRGPRKTSGPNRQSTLCQLELGNYFKQKGDIVMKPSHRRQFLRLAAGAALPAFSPTARAQVYPARPITLVLPFAAGGGADVVLRIITERMRTVLGQTIIIEN